MLIALLYRDEVSYIDSREGEGWNHESDISDSHLVCLLPATWTFSPHFMLQYTHISLFVTLLSPSNPFRYITHTHLLCIWFPKRWTSYVGEIIVALLVIHPCFCFPRLCLTLCHKEFGALAEYLKTPTTQVRVFLKNVVLLSVKKWKV